MFICYYVNFKISFYKRKILSEIISIIISIISMVFSHFWNTLYINNY